MRSRTTALALLLSVVATQLASAQQAQTTRWEAAIQAFEKQDATDPPPKHAILFVGSSSIRGWDLKKSFPDLDAINRGFGGSEVSDSVQFAERIILKHEPRVVVVYAGDNDISRGESPQQVTNDFQKLVAAIHEPLPQTKIVFIAIKPSIQRWRLVEEMREANSMIREIAKKSELIAFVDVDTPMIGKDGRPRGELFAKDGLHLSGEGYKLWASLVAPHLTP